MEIVQETKFMGKKVYNLIIVVFANKTSPAKLRILKHKMKSTLYIVQTAINNQPSVLFKPNITNTYPAPAMIL